MAKEKLSDKVIRLEKEIDGYQKQIIQFINKMSDMQIQANEGFENSNDYRMMKSEIEKLQAINKLKDETISSQKKQLKDFRDKFSNMGRKERFTEEERQAIREDRESGKSIRALATEYKCSVGLVHKICSEIN